MSEQKVFVEGMSCANCANTVEKKFSEMNGVSSVNVDLEGKVATVETESSYDQNGYAEALADTPYEVKEIN